MILPLDEVEDLPFMPIEYVLPEYSRSKIEAAGKALGGTLADMDEAISVFRIAHNWRDAHVFPMRRVRYELAGVAKKAKADAISAARIKRMKSIRKKLRESRLTLYQIQDIGGCRAIVPTIGDLRSVVSLYDNGYSRHGVIRHWPYVDEPKFGGYRSHHIVLKFVGTDDDEIYNRQRIVSAGAKIPH